MCGLAGGTTSTCLAAGLIAAVLEIAHVGESPGDVLRAVPRPRVRA
jgi:hypothetical protein